MRLSLRSLRRVLAVTLFGAVATTGAAGVANASNPVPFKDPNAVGVIGFCNKAGQQITHGSLDTKPFVWRAVSSQAAVAPYNGKGRSATLFAYQPRKDVAPGQWSGEELTAAATYSNPAHPMAAATDRDIPLKFFVGDYPPDWDGLVQVRMYLGAYNSELDSVSYPATVLKITGRNWQVVSGGSVACNSGTAVSIASLLPTASPNPRHSDAGKPGASSTARPNAAGGGTRVSTPSSGAAAPKPGTTALSSTALASDSHDSGRHLSAILAAVIAGVILLVVVAYVATRRRRAAPSSGPSIGSAHNRSEKGR